jgi:hypothetical protein
MYTMKESVAVAKEADAKKGVSPTKSDNSIQRVRNEPERQLGSLRDVIGNIRRDGDTPSVESIAAELSSTSSAQRAPALLALQQTHGNLYVQRVVAGIQAKLVVGQPGDKYEQEADRVADEVMRMSEAKVQREIEPEKEEELIQTKPLAEEITPLAQRQVEEEEEELVQPKLVANAEYLIQRQVDGEEEDKEFLQTKELTGHNAEITHDLESRIQAIRDGGQPLPESVRAYFEPRFGRDFSQVRVHTDTRAADSARAVNARAFTTGQDVVFGVGMYDPCTTTGKRLLAHELTHVVQQRGMPGGRLLQRDADRFDETVLQAYLGGLTATGNIENNRNSDNKARAVVDAWRLGGSPYVLEAERKTLMIRQMQRRVTGNKDEQAILEILERSYIPELSSIFRSISADDLKSDFQGTERERLQDFYARRFEGGMYAVLSGTIAPRGYPVPLGLNIEEAAGRVYDISDIRSSGMELPGSQTSWNVPCVLGILCSQDEAVVSQLSTLEVNRIDRIDVERWDFSSGVWTSRTVHPGGLHDPGVIGILSQREDGTPIDCDDAAQTLIHEVRHENQPQRITYYREMDAYTYDVGWAISRGIPNRQSLRTTNSGGEIPDPEAIDQHVQHRYGPPPAGASGVTVVGHEPATGSAPAMTLVRNPDGERESEPNDRYIDHSTLVTTGVHPITPDKWDCPG